MDKSPKSILDISHNTATKVLQRMNKGCSVCGWNKSRCDIHHIIPKSLGGLNDDSNLCILCPNCHRLVHNRIIDSSTLLNIDNYLKEDWRNYYFGETL